MALALTRARWRHTMTAGPAATCYNASKSLCVRTTPPCASVTRLVPCVRPLMTECLVVVCAGMVGAPTTEASHPTLLTTGQGKGSIYLWILRHWLKQAVGKAVVSQESRPSSRGRWMDGDLDLGRRKKRGGSLWLPGRWVRCSAGRKTRTSIPGRLVFSPTTVGSRIPNGVYGEEKARRSCATEAVVRGARMMYWASKVASSKPGIGCILVVVAARANARASPVSCFRISRVEIFLVVVCDYTVYRGRL